MVAIFLGSTATIYHNEPSIVDIIIIIEQQHKKNGWQQAAEAWNGGDRVKNKVCVG